MIKEILSILFFVIIVFLFVLLLLSQIRISRLGNVLSRQAAKRKGIFKTKEIFFHESSVKFTDGGINYVITEYRPKGFNNGIGITVELNLMPDFELRICKAIFLNRFFQEKAIYTGNQDFDKEFIVESNNKGFFIDIVTADIQNKLLEYRLAKPDIQFKKGRLRILVYDINESEAGEAKLDGLIDIATMFCDKIRQKQLSPQS